MGKLKCQGRGTPREDDSISTTCSSLKQSGETQDGFYLTKEESADSVAASYCKMSKPGILDSIKFNVSIFCEGYVEGNINLESYALGEGPTVVLKIALQSHYFSGSRMKRVVCGNNYYFYSLTTITMKEDDEEMDIYEAFNKETGLYTIAEDGLYMIMVGDFNSYCDNVYVVGESTTKHFYQGQSTSNTQWLASGT